MKRCKLDGCKPSYRREGDREFIECQKCFFSIHNKINPCDGFTERQLLIDWDNAMDVKNSRILETKTVIKRKPKLKVVG